MSREEWMRRAAEKLIVAEVQLIVAMERMRVEQETTINRYPALADWKWRP